MITGPIAGLLNHCRKTAKAHRRRCDDWDPRYGEPHQWLTNNADKWESWVDALQKLISNPDKP